MKRRDLLILVPLCLSFAVYHSLFRGYFSGDDYFLLYWLANNDFAEFILAPFGGHIHIMRNMAFFILACFAGTDPAPYYWTVLLTHLLNVALLFLVIRNMTRSSRLAAFGAALWGMCPVHQGALTWLSAYGQVIAATFVLLILLGIARNADSDTFPRRSERAAWYALALAAAMSFGVGIAAAMVLPLVAALLLPRPTERPILHTPLLSLVVVVPLLYLLLNFFAYAWGSTIASTFGIEHQIGSPLTTLVAVGQLITYGVAQLLLGSVYSPIQYPDIIAVAVVSLFAGAYVVALVWSRPTLRHQLLAVGALAIAPYGIIALGRGRFFAALGARFAAQQRYHYFSAIFLALAVCLLLRRASAWSFVGERLKNLLLIGWVCGSLVAWRATGGEIDHHPLDRQAVARVVGLLRSEIEKHPPGANVYIENRHFSRFGRFIVKGDLPGWAAVFTIYFPSNVVDGRRIYFIEPDPEIRAVTARGRRTRTLIVAAAPDGGDGG